MNLPDVSLRVASAADLAAANAVIERAVMGWDLPERVKRLSLSTYRYTPLDLEHLTVTLAEGEQGECRGVAAWEPADVADTPEGRDALLLHGIYVDPAAQGAGIGARLLAAATAAARAQGRGGLLVKAQRGAEGFFVSRGFRKLPVLDPQRDYPHRYWKSLQGD